MLTIIEPSVFIQVAEIALISSVPGLLRPLAHETGIKVSIQTTFRSGFMSTCLYRQTGGSGRKPGLMSRWGAEGFTDLD